MFVNTGKDYIRFWLQRLGNSFVFFYRIEFTYVLFDVVQMVIDYWQKCEM